MAESATTNEKIFLQARELTSLKPLQLQFHKGELNLSKNNQTLIRQWISQIHKSSKAIKYDIPVYIHSYASPPTGIRDLNEATAHHEAIRVAFNRGLIAQNLLEQNGISKNRLILKALESDKDLFIDRITITTRQE